MYSSNSNNLIKNLPPAKFPIPHLNTIWKTLISGFILFFLSNRWLWVILDGKSSQEYLVNAGVPQGSTLGPTLFLLYIRGCAYYIFTSLFFMSKREHLWNKEECFLFHFENSFRSWDNQILTFQIFRCHDFIKSPSMKYKTHFTE